MDNQKIIKDSGPSVVLIELVINNEPNSSQGQLSVRGTGFIISKSGEVATCAHVYDQIPENQRQYLMINIPDQVDNNRILNYRRFKAELSRVDKEHDLAILKIQGSGDYIFNPINNFGDLSDVVEGDDLLILGYPLATELISSGFGITMTADQCIASSIKRRSIDGSLDFFMVDTHINNGSSGSPVFLKSTGEIVGVASGKVISARVPMPDSKTVVEIPANIGICRPINYLKELIK